MSEMKSCHRLFLQGIMSRRLLDETEIKELLKICCESCGVNVPSSMDGTIDLINTNIQPVHMKIKKGISEADGKHYWILANTVENATARLPRSYTVIELDFFKKLIETVVVEGDNGTIKSVHALNLVDQLEKKMKKQDAEELLERFVEEKWLTHERGQFGLSIRTMLELEHYIKEMYPDHIVFCVLCKQMLIKGETCQQCSKRMHKHCLGRYFQQNPRKNCASCKKPWH